MNEPLNVLEANWKQIGGSEINTYMLHNKSAVLSRPCGVANKNIDKASQRYPFK